MKVFSTTFNLPTAPHMVGEVGQFSGTLFPTGHQYQVLTTEGALLIAHIIGEHLRPNSFNLFGIPSYDIDLAKQKGINLDPVASTIWMELSSAVIHMHPLALGAHGSLASTEDGYRSMLARTLVYMARVDTLSISEPTAREKLAEVGLGTVSIDARHFLDFDGNSRGIANAFLAGGMRVFG